MACRLIEGTVDRDEVRFPQDGIEVGDELSVLVPGRPVKGSVGEGEVQLPDRKVANLVVVKTERTASTALVTQSKDSFLVGARRADKDNAAGSMKPLRISIRPLNCNPITPKLSITGAMPKR
jgi:hypothetical protein